MRGQVAGEQDDVGGVRDVRERLVDARADALVRVQVAGRCDADARHRSDHYRGFGRAHTLGTRRSTMGVDFDFEVILDAMKKAAGALRDAEVPFALGGGLAVWARGGAKTEHDVDFFVKPEDAERAQQALVAAGLEPETPPEGWLLKAWDDGVLVDLIFEPRGGPIDDEWFERAEELDVYAVSMLVASLDDVLVTKLLALTEQNLDYSSVLEIARAVREQIDWDEVRRRCDGSPYAKAFLVLVEELGVAPAASTQPLAEEEELLPGLPPRVGGGADACARRRSRRRNAAQLVDRRRDLVLDLDRARAAGVVRRDGVEILQRPLRAGLDQLARAKRRDLPRADSGRGLPSPRPSSGRRRAARVPSSHVAPVAGHEQHRARPTSRRAPR